MSGYAQQERFHNLSNGSKGDVPFDVEKLK